ncbi:MAG: type II secretion system F family protein [Nitrospinaceae bacterium]
MPTYFYQATDHSGKFVEGDLEAPDYRIAVEKVRKLNYFPVRVSAEPNRAQLGDGLKLPSVDWLQRVTTRELLNFTQQLATLVGAGLTLDKGLTIIVQLTEHPKARSVFSDVQKRVHAGSTFAEALAAYPEVFPTLYVSMVRAGEVGGVLTLVLDRLTDFLETSQDMRAKIVSSLIYPLILLVVGGAAVVFLVTYVVPKFTSIFADMEASLPLPTRLLLGFSQVASQYWWALILVGVAAIGGASYYVRSDSGKPKWDGFLLHIPLVGDLIRKIEVSRFARTFATLQKSGVPVLQAMGIVRKLVNNLVISKALDGLQDALKGGQGLSRPLAKAGVFPPLAVHMIVVGEETGALDDMLVKVADIFDKEVDTALKRVVGLVGPVLILLMGMCVGFIVISVLWGMISINDLAF